MEKRNQFQADQLGGIDGLGRELPMREQAGPLREGRFVGIFYFLWLGQHGTSGPHDNTRILEEWPEAVHNADHPAWGPENAFHFWGEPLYGYYLNDDAFVLRKHVQLLTSAGIDFLVFDTTNKATYKKIYDVLFQILDDIHAQGFKVPQFVFYTNTESGETVKEIYEDIYKPGRYPHLWFQWKGKPLMIGDPTECSEEIRQFFTFRLNQWPNEEAKENGFPWIEFKRPQRVFYNDEGEKEIINVSVAQHPSVAMSDTPFYAYGDNWGRNYHEGFEEADRDSFEMINQGMNIAEQWDFALKEDPQMIFITGWNEWIAMRLQGTAERPILFVDQATLNFSRDIEPMKNGYGDHYYMQMISYIRRFKGGSEPSQTGCRLEQDLLMAELDFTPWSAVPQEYRDFEGDTQPRNHPGYGDLYYRNETGRNQFLVMKTAHTDEHLCFYVRTKDSITAYKDRHWMMLLIRIYGEGSTGWEGYHYIVNRKVVNDTTTMLEKSVGGWDWQEVGEIAYAVSGNELQLEIPRAMLKLDKAERELHIGFKWVDNMQNEGEIMDFLQYGDTAPEGRLHFIYRHSE